MDKIFDDIALARNISEGDYESFRLVYSRYSRILYTMALRMLKDESMAAETVQTVFVSLWENRRQLAVRVNLKNYLYSAAKYCVLNQIRDRNVELRGNYRYAQILSETEDSIAGEIEMVENLAKMSEAFDKLPPQQSKVLKMRSRGLSNPEIAEMLGISISTVKYHYNEGLKALRKIMNAVLVFVLLTQGLW